MVGDELDLEIIAAGLSPNDFLGATLPTLGTMYNITGPDIARI
jgi:hypothetical protein